jgi:tRNA(Ile)-lysidine synthase
LLAEKCERQPFDRLRATDVEEAALTPDSQRVDRFTRDLDALIAPGARIGIAVSGGPDSLALLLLAIAARPEQIEAATVDHALREGSRDEAELVARVCARRGIPHTILTAEWGEKPATAIQERARTERYRLLSQWARDRRLDAVATAHHLDDQAETLLMRLNRGVGVRGLAGMRPANLVPGSDIPLLRPLLGWRRTELERICTEAAFEPARDPSNDDAQYERVRVRRALADADWLDPKALAASASHVGDAEAALEWTANREWARAVTEGGVEILYRPGEAPPEIRRRIVARVVARLATEGQGANLRGRELDRLLEVLGDGGQATVRGVQCTGGSEWRFGKAPTRRS